MKTKNFLILCRVAQVIAALGVVAGLIMGIIAVVTAIGYALDLDFEQANHYALIGFISAALSCFGWHIEKELERAWKSQC